VINVKTLSHEEVLAGLGNQERRKTKEINAKARRRREVTTVSVATGDWDSIEI